MMDDKGKNAEILADKGFAYLRDGDYDEALMIAKKLEELRYTAAFDIAAQAHAGLGNLEKAVEVLERGVTEEPDCWLNWQLLGNYRSYIGDYDPAAEAYDRALRCPDSWQDSVRLNQAILAVKRDENEEALRFLEKVKDPKLTLRAAYTNVSALHRLGRLDEALTLADVHLDRDRDAGDDEESLAGITASRGRIRIEQSAPSDEVRLTTMDALEEYWCSGELLARVRDIDGCYSRKSQYFRLLIHVRIPADHPSYQEVKGYFITYDVVAETPDNALKWVREFEQIDKSLGTLCIEESDVLEERPDDPMGVYWRTGRSYYENEDDE